MLDFPTPEVTNFLKNVPTVWDETRVLTGSGIGGLAVIARRKGNDWFVVAFNGEQPRTYQLNLDFLDSKLKNATLLLDDSTRTKVLAEHRQFNRTNSLTLNLASGGGCVLWLLTK